MKGRDSLMFAACNRSQRVEVVFRGCNESEERHRERQNRSRIEAVLNNHYSSCLPSHARDSSEFKESSADDPQATMMNSSAIRRAVMLATGEKSTLWYIRAIAGKICHTISSKLPPSHDSRSLILITFTYFERLLQRSGARNMPLTRRPYNRIRGQSKEGQNRRGTTPLL